MKTDLVNYRSWRVTTTGGSVLVVARTIADALRAGLELTGPHARLLTCLQEDDW